MKINYLTNRNLKFKIAVPLFSLLVLLFLASGYVIIESLNETQMFNTQKLIDTKIRDIDNTIEFVGNKALYISSIISEMQIVKDAYAEYYKTGNLQQSSNLLDNQFAKINNIILESSGYKPRIHFHLPPARSFCRCWSEVRGDDISDFRNSVLDISNDHSFIKGIETGRGGFVIRGLAPIFSNDDKYYGSVETFFNINYLVREINKSTNEEFAVFMDTDLLSIATDFLEENATNIVKDKEIIGGYILVEKTNNFIIENIIGLNADSVEFCGSCIETEKYNYVIIPLTNYLGKINGIGVLQVDISEYRQQLINTILFDIGIFIFFLIVILILLNIFIHKIITRIKVADKSLQKLAKGELIEKLPIIQMDELGSMQTSLNKLQDNIKRNTNFAIEVGSGNLKTEYSPISSKDLLGNALFDMQHKLKKYSEDLHNAYNKLTENEQKFKKLSNLTFEGILIHKEGVVIDANFSLMNMFGYTLEELKGKNVIAALIPKKCHALIYENIKKKYALPYEIEGIKKDGTKFPLEIEARNISIEYENDNIRVTAFRDISVRKNSEKEIRKLFAAVEQSANAILITDINGDIEYSNPKFTDLTGYTAKEAKGKNPRILQGNKQDSEFYKNIWDTIKSGKTWKGEFSNKTKDGKLFWDYSTISPIKDKEGNIVHYLAIKEDISKRKKLIEELVEAKNKAEESDRLKTAFLKNISHEIRTPMNGILGFVNLLNDTNITASEQQEFIDMINTSSNRMLNTISSIMEISMLETGQTIMKYSSININDELNKIFDSFKPEFKGRDISFNLIIPKPKLNEDIKVDKEKLNIIFKNLIANAIKYTQDGSINFGYEIKGKNLEFYVKDTGIGIPLKRQEAIFDRFIQAIDHEGAGLGLSITDAYVKMIGGKLWVNSVGGEGSQFYFTIPIIIANKKAKLKQLETDINTELIEKKIKVLIVEDDEYTDVFLTEVLKNVSSKIFNARTGIEAVKLCRENPDLDLILMDIKMPEMDGYEACMEIRKFNKDVIIIAQTAYALYGDREKALEAGCNDYISKPIDRQLLLEMISSFNLVVQLKFNKKQPN